MNNVSLVGRLTKDADLRYTSNGNAVANITLAVNRNYANNEGVREADFINCIFWNKTAELVSGYTKKGTLIGVTGSIQTRTYENNENKTVYVTEVVVNNLQFLESRQTQENREIMNKRNSNTTKKKSTNKKGLDYENLDEHIPF